MAAKPHLAVCQIMIEFCEPKQVFTRQVPDAGQFAASQSCEAEIDVSLEQPIVPECQAAMGVAADRQRETEAPVRIGFEHVHQPGDLLVSGSGQAGCNIGQLAVGPVSQAVDPRGVGGRRRGMLREPACDVRCQTSCLTGDCTTRPLFRFKGALRKSVERV